MTNKLLVNIFRAGFIAIFLIEIFRWKVLNSSVNFSWQGLVITVVLVFILLEFAVRWLEKKFNTPFSWVSYAAGFTSLFLDAIGDMFFLYTIFSPWYDKALHFIGGGAVAIIIYEILRAIRLSDPASFSRGWLLVLTIFISFFLGFGYEWLEYAEDVFYWHRQVRLGDAYDTMDDMQMNFLGILLGTFLRAKFQKDPHRHNMA